MNGGADIGPRGAEPFAAADPRRAVEAARAKVNLVLDLVGLRPDGYTEIATVFQELEAGDRVEVEFDPSGPGRTSLVTRGGPEPCPPVENLAYRAAEAFRKRFGLSGEVRIAIEKWTPAGAGLGGGSADAAATLRALARLAPTRPDPADLAAVAAPLGADVPYFLVGGLAVGRGRGDELEPLPDLPSWPLVLVRSGRPLGTAEVYREARAELTAPRDAPNIRRFLRHLRETPRALPPLSNDLQPAATKLEPRIAEALARLSDLGGAACMTGSGSTVFGLFASDAAAEHAAGALRVWDPEAFVAATATRPRGGPRPDDDGTTGRVERG